MEQGNRPWKASWAGESAPLPEISQRSRPTPFRGLSGAYSPAPFCRRVTELTCGDLRSLALTPTLPLSTSSSLRDNSYPTGPSLFTTEGGSVAGKSVCSSGLSPTGFSSLLISAKVCQAEPFCRYLHGLCSFHTGLRTGTVEGQPASYAFWTTLSFHTLAENTRIGFAHSAFSACKVCRNFADLVHFAPGFCEAGSGMTPLRGMSRSDRGEIGIQKEKSPSIGDFSFWVPGGTRTHDIQNHNLTL